MTAHLRYAGRRINLVERRKREIRAHMRLSASLSGELRVERWLNFRVLILLLLVLPHLSTRSMTTGFSAFHDEGGQPWESQTSEDRLAWEPDDPDETPSWLASRKHDEGHLRAWETVMNVQDFSTTGVQVPQQFDEAVRRILIAVRKHLCHDVVDNDIRCMLVIEAVLASPGNQFDEIPERVALAAISPRALFFELLQNKLLTSEPLTGEVSLTRDAAAAATLVRKAILSFINTEVRPHFAEAACFNFMSCLPDYTL